MLQRFLLCLCFTSIYAWTTPRLYRAFFKEQAGLRLFTYPALWSTGFIIGKSYIASLQKNAQLPKIVRLQK